MKILSARVPIPELISRVESRSVFRDVEHSECCRTATALADLERKNNQPREPGFEQIDLLISASIANVAIKATGPVSGVRRSVFASVRWRGFERCDSPRWCAGMSQASLEMGPSTANAWAAPSHYALNVFAETSKRGLDLGLAHTDPGPTFHQRLNQDDLLWLALEIFWSRSAVSI